MPTASLTPGLPPLYYNSTLLTVDASGNPVSSPFTMQSFQTGSNVQFVNNQLKSGISWIPIRRSEQFVQFTGVWSHQRYNEMYAFLSSIRIHQQAALNYATPPLMTLVYETMGVQYQGMVEDASTGDTRFVALYTKQFNMEYVPDLLEQPSGVTQQSGYLPTANNATQYGPGWYQIQPGTSVTQDPTASSSNNNQPPNMPGSVNAQ